jgi:hypothetical protein
LYRWNCSHEAFFPYACKDGEPLWRPPEKAGSARRLLQFAWADLTEFEALRAYEEKRQLALRSGDGGAGGCAEATARAVARAVACAVACTALLTCLVWVLTLACVWRAARRLHGPQPVKLEVSCVL